MAAAEPLLSLRGVSRRFQAGDQTITVLDAVDLDIWPGEMVAIVGASGSGKSTLMNILGVLDRPSDGTYRFAGREVGAMDAADRARLRREHFGFIFQRYQLLPELDALGNVEVPAIYNGATRQSRRDRAARLLSQLGLGDRADHRPGQLSGGQQQRVSVARALINGGEVILADEPTGALDTKSGAELIALLNELHAKGHTIIIVTHDPGLASQVDRTIEIRDGRIIADTRRNPRPEGPRLALDRPARKGLLGGIDRLREALSMSLRAMGAHRLRTFLTMLGIVIGIASVVSVVALGNGSQQAVLENIASLGTSTIDIRRGTGFGDRRANAVRTLVPEDATALASQPYAAAVSPEVSMSRAVTRGAVTASASIRGVDIGYFDLSAYTVAAGQIFTPASVDLREQVAVLDRAATDTLFPGGTSPVGEVILIGRVPMTVIGVVEPTGETFGPSSIRVFIPYTTAAARITGQTVLDTITVRVADDYDMTLAEGLITDLMTGRHGKQDFFLTNSDTIRETIQSTTQTLTLLVAAIAVISLFVGGIGVMNIMLVSVTERTREIGVRIAVGARQSDIATQFLIEAVLVCLIGGALGVVLAYGIGYGVERFFPDIRLIYSTTTVVAAFVSSTVIGIAFGFLPARSASKLDPVVALARE
ncbi:MAG: hypothetical protein RLZZ528_284 [Pseudomonadota bacterium]